MPVIRVSDATWERLKGYARPLEDSAEDVVRLALDALDKTQGCRAPNVSPIPTKAPVSRHAPKAAQGNKLPQKRFRQPLLQVLWELGGRASTKDIRELLKPRMAPLLGEADYQTVSTGDPRWWNAVCWERNELVKEGLLLSNSDRGIWELSERSKSPVLPSVDLSGPKGGDAPEVFPATWRDDIKTALQVIDLGAGAPLVSIYRTVAEIRTKEGRSVPVEVEATIRRTLEDNCSDSDNYRGVDMFYMPKGKGAGIWSLRSQRGNAVLKSRKS